MEFTPTRPPTLGWVILGQPRSRRSQSVQRLPRPRRLRHFNTGANASFDTHTYTKSRPSTDAHTDTSAFANTDTKHRYHADVYIGRLCVKCRRPEHDKLWRRHNDD